MFAILYETGTSGFYLGSDTTFEESETRFSRITDDLLNSIKGNKKRISMISLKCMVFSILLPFAKEMNATKLLLTKTK